MIQALKSPVGVGVIVFIVAMTVIGAFMGPTRCNSGWASPSIGTQGACSHHGGIDRVPGMLRFLASLALGVVAGIRASRSNEKGTPKPAASLNPIRRTTFAATSRRWQDERPVHATDQRSTAVKPSVGDRTACPECNETMRAISIDRKIVLRCPACGIEKRYR